jgi:methionyl-tRNA synthetase
MLLSAGLSLPTQVLVHDYLTVDGRKLSKSSGTTIDPAELAAEVGADAVRWWLIRDVPRVGDADFTRERLVARANNDLAGGVGNLVNRVVTMIHRYYDGQVPSAEGQTELATICAEAPGQIADALDGFDFRQAANALWTIVEASNKYIETTRPWELAKNDSSRLPAVLAALHHACTVLAEELQPFLPGAAARIKTQCTPTDGVLPPAAPLFPRIT